MYIYKITNIINNKVYIGQTIHSIEKRWSRHNWNCTKERNAMAITNAIIKYGSENFKIEEIDRANNLEELNEKEIYYIKQFNSISPNGYKVEKSIQWKKTIRKYNKSYY